MVLLWQFCFSPLAQHRQQNYARMGASLSQNFPSRPVNKEPLVVRKNMLSLSATGHAVHATDSSSLITTAVTHTGTGTGTHTRAHTHTRTHTHTHTHTHPVPGRSHLMIKHLEQGAPNDRNRERGWNVQLHGLVLEIVLLLLTPGTVNWHAQLIGRERK